MTPEQIKLIQDLEDLKVSLEKIDIELKNLVAELEKIR